MMLKYMLPDRVLTQRPGSNHFKFRQCSDGNNVFLKKKKILKKDHWSFKKNWRCSYCCPATNTLHQLLVLSLNCLLFFCVVRYDTSTDDHIMFFLILLFLTMVHFKGNEIKQCDNCNIFFPSLLTVYGFFSHFLVHVIWSKGLPHF